MWLALYCSSALSGTLASVLPIFHCSPKHENKMLRLSLFAMPVPPAAAAKLLQLCPTLCDPTDGSPPGSSISGISRQEYWSGLPFPSPMHACMLSCFSSVWLCDPMDWSPPGSSVHGISRQEYWSGLPFPPPGDLPDPRIDPTFPMSPELQADSLPTEPSGKPY